MTTRTTGIVAAVAGAAVALGAQGRARRRRLEARFPLRLPGMPLHDPFVVPDPGSGLYHLYSSNHPELTGDDAVGTMVYRSPDLLHWSLPTVVFRATPDLWAADGGWAPEVHRWRGRWYLFTTLHDEAAPLSVPVPGGYGTPVATPQHRRGTVIAAADSLLGPFEVVDPTGPVAPADFMTLDGSLFVDRRRRPWMVYAHEWLQKIDGTMEAVPLRPDLTGAAGDPVHLFKASDAGWIGREMPKPSANQIVPYITDGPQLIRLPGGALAMLWSTYEKNADQPDGTVSGGYVQTWAISPSGELAGPWEQRDPLVREDSGHGMVFRTFGGTPMLIVHRPFTNARGKLYEIALRRDGLRLGRRRDDLDGGD
ncbi:glycosyl hydrolase family 43 [Amnibacterium kyonggiense]|uniref:Glycosyl hydrolase family 43 n=2 Tax=Amnibacterium kyonggiense TaxID=595671 RepID=A0A4R7FLB6_9MICO|nr:glycosyl hydrolase family 43 [Amnibacterium kyonggiense]